MARKRSKKGTKKPLTSQCKQCAREQEPKVDGEEERAPTGVYGKYFNSGKSENGANRAGKGQWSKTGGKKGGKGQEKGGKSDTRLCKSCGKTGNCTNESWNRSLNAVDEDKGDISEEVHEDEDELHAWCLLEESENEQWEEVICNKSKLKLKKLPVSRAEF